MQDDSEIFVTKTFLPPKEEFNDYINKIWHAGLLTNQGPLLKEFESRTRAYLGVANFQFVANGTLALQLALRAIDIQPGDEIITTPFSYVATTSAILWERGVPVFVDIDDRTLNIDPYKIEAAITPKTKAILAVHVFGIPCNTEAIKVIADKHNLKVIYDGAHAFGVKSYGTPILSFGDISTCSFHATKVFHTIEGGGLISNDDKLAHNIELQKRFGHNGDEHIMLGINAKANEFQAAMGLALLPYIDTILQERKRVHMRYMNGIDAKIYRLQDIEDTLDYNFAYFPVLCKDTTHREKVIEALEKKGVHPRRYFYPSLNTLPYVSYVDCSVSENIADRILCLPIYPELGNEQIDKIVAILNETKTSTI